MQLKNISKAKQLLVESDYNQFKSKDKPVNMLANILMQKSSKLNEETAVLTYLDTCFTQGK